MDANDPEAVAAAFAPDSDQAWQHLFPVDGIRAGWRRQMHLHGGAVEAAAWRDAGFGHPDVRGATNAGLTLSDAVEWRDALGGDMGTSLSWHELTGTIAEASRWIATGVPICDAWALNESGITKLEHALVFVERGLANEKDCDVIAWCSDNGWTPDQIAQRATDTGTLPAIGQNP